MQIYARARSHSKRRNSLAVVKREWKVEERGQVDTPWPAPRSDDRRSDRV